MTIELDFVQIGGTHSHSQSQWRWDDENNVLVHDRDVTVEKKETNSKQKSKKITVHKYEDEDKVRTYTKTPHRVGKNLKIVVGDLIRRFRCFLLFLFDEQRRLFYLFQEKL